MYIRKFVPSDGVESAELFYHTVHEVNAGDYTKEQLDVWASGEVDLDQWIRSFLGHDSFAAVDGGRIVGFGDIDKTGYLDRLYVHKDYQGRGIASAICDELEKMIQGKVVTHASITARPFFEKRGYRVLKEQQVERQGIFLTNYVMEKYVADTPVLETERLLLRKFTEDDLAALSAIYSDEEVNKYLPWFPLKTMEEAERFRKEQYDDIYAKRCACKYAVCLKGDNIPIGYIHISMDESHDLGYGLCREFWHKGIMTEAGRAVIEQAERIGIPYITATHDIQNLRSGGVMIRLGMQYQYSYEEQWQPKDVLVTFRMYQLNLDHEKDRVYRKYWERSAVHYIEAEISV